MPEPLDFSGRELDVLRIIYKSNSVPTSAALARELGVSATRIKRLIGYIRGKARMDDLKKIARQAKRDGKI